MNTERVWGYCSTREYQQVLQWEPNSERIITACFKGPVRNLTVIQCYAPTEVAEQDAKQSFYAQLQREYDKVKKKNITIVIEDLNAQIGNDNTGMEEVMGGGETRTWSKKERKW